MSPAVGDQGAVRIGISACLLGERVRYDAGHKLNRLLADTLGPYVEWVSVCPEVEVGMGIPREALRLVQLADGAHLVGIETGTDHTRVMREFARRWIERVFTYRRFEVL